MAIVQMYFFQELQHVAGEKVAKTWLKEQQAASPRRGRVLSSGSSGKIGGGSSPMCKMHRNHSNPAVLTALNDRPMCEEARALSLDRRRSEFVECEDDPRNGLIFTDAAHLVVKEC
eukprot:3582988-Rhodomonas_salina.1